MPTNHHASKSSIWIILTVMILCAVFLFVYFRKVKSMQKSYSSMNEHYARIVEDLKTQNQTLKGDKEALNQEIYDMTHPKNGVMEHGRLHIEGTQLQGQKGEPVILRGVSSHGLAWYPEFSNYNALKALKDRGVNVFRIAMYVDGYNCYLKQRDMNTKLLYSAIENALAADLYAIVDWHVLKDRNPLYNLEAAAEFFETVAKKYGDEPGILYEICNEPNGSTSFEDIVNYANTVIPIIRKYAPNAVILVGTPNFSSSLDSTQTHDITYENICFTYHYYSHHIPLEEAVRQIRSCLDRGTAVIVTEWGYKGVPSDGGNWDETVGFLDFLDEEKISWVNWSLCNKDEDYSVIRPETEALGQWTDEELSPTGQYVLNRITQFFKKN